MSITSGKDLERLTLPGPRRVVDECEHEIGSGTCFGIGSNSSVASGRKKVESALREMPGLRNIIDAKFDFSEFSGVDILGCVTLTRETGALVLSLVELGANVRWCSDNRFASDDDVVAYLVSQGIPVFARANMTEAEHRYTMELACDFPGEADSPVYVIDDGADITNYIVEHNADFFRRVRGITEQTGSGLTEVRNLYANSRLPVPVINVGECFTKKYFDNYYGVGKSLVSGLDVALERPLDGMLSTVFGYGPVGKGTAVELRAAGCEVAIVECDLIKAVQAHFDGYEILSPSEAVTRSDIVITATGCMGVISKELLDIARDGLVLCNVGHSSVEYDVNYLQSIVPPRRMNRFMDAFELAPGRTVYSLCNGSLANIIAGPGCSPALMSLTFTLQILGQREFLKHPERYSDNRLHALSREIEIESVKLNYPRLAENIYRLSPRQQEHLGLCRE